MPDTEFLMSRRVTNIAYSYGERDTMLYALAIGMGRDPVDERELDYVYERRGTLRALPSQAITVARYNLITGIGLKDEKLLHAEQHLTIHQPLPAAADLLADHRVLSVADKGLQRGLMIETEARVRLADGTPVFDINNLFFARGDGGMGSSGTQQRMVTQVPQRAPDVVRATRTDPHQALLYRLTGDRNVIHGDPAIARSVGFRSPILHGSCTLALACREILVAVCDYDGARMKALGTRFTSVAYPGELLETDIWLDGSTVSFRTRAPERDVVVLDHGQCRLLPL